MVRAIFTEGENYKETEKIYRWNYGEKLEICGLSLPPAVEIHFTYKGKKGDAIRRIGTTVDKITTVYIPEEALEQQEDIKAYVYLSSKEEGRTEKVIKIPMIDRARPEAWERPEDKEMFLEAIVAVNHSADRAEAAEESAEAWAHGNTAHPDRDEDNAKYYAAQARDALREIPGEVKDAKADIDAYVTEKRQELKGETGNVYFAAFKVVGGRLVMYSDPAIDRVRFTRKGSRLAYRLTF